MNVGIAGLGLMGGSFGRTLVKNTNCVVYGYDVCGKTIEKAKELSAIHRELKDGDVSELDVLILAVTPDKIAGLLETFAPKLKRGATVTDFCGIKRKVTTLMREYAEKYPDLVFIGGHPMAGRELSGIEHSKSDLFDNASMILVNVNASENALRAAGDFYLSAGFKKIEICSAEEHDEMIAFTSQLCHVVSNAFIKSDCAEKHDGFSAGSYKDLTRVARLDPDMWAGLMTANADYLGGELSGLIERLNAYLAAIVARDEKTLKRLLKEGSDRKIAIDVKGGKTNA